MQLRGVEKQLFAIKMYKQAFEVGVADEEFSAKIEPEFKNIVINL